MFELISIGSELLSGATINTNASLIAERLLRKGYSVLRITTVPDEPEAILAAFKESLARSEQVIVTGGLGDTHDDITAHVAKTLFAKAPKVIPNHYGTAAGLNFDDRLYLLPGVPSQMEPMLDEELLPTFPQGALKVRTLHLALTSEGDVDPLLQRLMAEDPSLDIGICPSYGKVSIYIRSSHSPDPAAEAISRAFPDVVYEESSLAHAVYQALLSRGQTLSLAESCTGGHVAAALTSIPGASNVFLGSIVAYSNLLKERLLGVDPLLLKAHGAVSKECALAMAQGAQVASQSDYALSITGIAGPTGGSEDKPIGTVYIGLARPKGEITSYLIQAKGRSRSSITEYTVQAAFSLLYQAM